MKKILLLNFALVLTLLVNAQTIVPELFNGNWFRTDNAEWGISLMDSASVYKSKERNYTEYKKKEGLGTLPRPEIGLQRFVGSLGSVGFVGNVGSASFNRVFHINSKT